VKYIYRLVLIYKADYNCKWCKTKYIRGIHTNWDDIISPFKKKVSIIKMEINKPNIIRDALDTSNINGVIKYFFRGKLLDYKYI